MGSGAEDDKKATKLALDTLGRTEINEINFVLNNINVSSSMYKQVKQAIVDGKITVMVAPNLLTQTEGGRYYAELKLPNGDVLFDLLVLRSSESGDNKVEQLTKEALLVHECTHAGFNLLKVAGMTHALDEAGAYAAEAIYEIARMPAMGGDPEKVTIREAIRKAAWEFGLMLQRSKADAANIYYTSPDFAVVYYETLNKLLTAIITSDEYKAVAKDPVKNVGVGRQWILQKAH